MPVFVAQGIYKHLSSRLTVLPNLINNFEQDCELVNENYSALAISQTKHLNIRLISANIYTFTSNFIVVK